MCHYGDQEITIPGRRVEGAGEGGAASGLGVTELNAEESWDDLDMIEDVLPRNEFLLEPFLNKLKGMLLLLVEERLVDGDEPRWQEDVSYRKGMVSAVRGEAKCQRRNLRELFLGCVLMRRFR